MNHSKIEENLILIPARFGSTRVKNKNLKKINNKPLIYYRIRSSLQSKSGRVIVSTDSEKIAKIAKKFGADVPFLRPKEISRPKSSSISCIIHTLKWLKENENWFPDNIAFCPPTNPFINSISLKKMFLLIKKKNINSIVTIYTPEVHPYNLISIKKSNRLLFGKYKINNFSWFDFERTQDWPISYAYSPGIRITKAKYFIKYLNKNLNLVNYKTFDTKNCMGFKISQNEAFDINNKLDFIIAKDLFKSLK